VRHSANAAFPLVILVILLPGAQTCFPYADFNFLKLPGTPGDEFEDDFIMLADVFPTGYHATEQAHVTPGDTVAIFGAGPVGLMAALSAKIRGASEIYVVDNVKERLALVEKIGATPVDFSKGDAVDQILALRKPHVENVPNLRAGAGDKMPGVMCTIDAIGYEAKRHGTGATDNATKQDAAALLTDLVRVTNPTGHIGLIGVYFPQDPGAKGDEKRVFSVSRSVMRGTKVSRSKWARRR